MDKNLMELKKRKAYFKEQFVGITASVRTTNRMNALLNEAGRKKLTLMKAKKDSTDGEEEEDTKPKIEIEYLRKNFNTDHIYTLIHDTIDERLQWDRFSRMYDPWRSVQLVESLSQEIKDRVKLLKHQRYRIICLLSIIEKYQQGVHYKMMHVMDPKKDNFASYVYERPTYILIAVVYLVYKE